MKKLLVMAAVLGMTFSTYGQVWVGSDSFTSLDTAKWSTTYANGYNNAYSAVSVTGGKLLYSSTNNSANTSAYLMWQQNPTTSTNWLSSVDVHVDSINFSSNQTAQIGVYVFDSSNMANGASVKLQENSGGTLKIVGNGITPSVTPTNDISIAMGFDASSHLLTAYYDSTGSTDGYQWTTIGQIDTSSWSTSFTVALGGVSNNVNIIGGQFTFDNFSLQAIPEPSGKFLLMIGMALAVVFHRHQHWKKTVQS